MKPIQRNIIAVIVGLVVGGSVNMGLIMLSPYVIPPPAGVDMTTTVGLTAGIHLLEPKHFVFPFLAHALGALSGALCAFLIAATRRSVFAYALGAFNLAGGVAAAYLIPAPVWFVALDLTAAYIPMAWLAIHVGRRISNDQARG